MKDSQYIQIQGVDKVPRLTDYVLPDRVRIADASRVRLGAYLSPGTTVMHEGFVNFNAGTLGASMVEGRISQGVVVGDGSDIGGGASIMGTLSGGGTHRVSIGRRSLLGANSGIGTAIAAGAVVQNIVFIVEVDNRWRCEAIDEHQCQQIVVVSAAVSQTEGAWSVLKYCRSKSSGVRVALTPGSEQRRV